MTIEGLKKAVEDASADAWKFNALAPEILALVEACNQAEFDACNEDEGTIGSSQIEAALFAFNVKLEAL